MKRVEALPVHSFDIVRPFSSRDEWVEGFHEKLRKGRQGILNVFQNSWVVLLKLIVSDC